MTCDTKLSQYFGEIFVLQTSEIKFSTFSRIRIIENRHITKTEIYFIQRIEIVNINMLQIAIIFI